MRGPRLFNNSHAAWVRPLDGGRVWSLGWGGLQGSRRGSCRSRSHCNCNCNCNHSPHPLGSSDWRTWSRRNLTVPIPWGGHRERGAEEPDRKGKAASRGTVVSFARDKVVGREGEQNKKKKKIGLDPLWSIHSDKVVRCGNKPERERESDNVWPLRGLVCPLSKGRERRGGAAALRGRAGGCCALCLVPCGVKTTMWP